MVQGVKSEPVFAMDREKNRFLRMLEERISEFNIKIYAYSILDDHVHLLIKSEIQELSSYMAKVLAAYAKYYNYKSGKKGKVFHSRFYSEAIETEDSFWNCIRYFHNHVVQLNGVRNITKYHYSSIKEFYLEDDYIVDAHLKVYIQNEFETLSEFVKFHRKKMELLVWDTEEDLQAQRMVLIQNVILKLALEEQVEKEEILEYYPYIEKCIKAGKKELKASQKEMQNILKNLKSR